MIICTAFSSSSCGISDNYAKVEEQFEDENYDVYVYNDDDYYFMYMEVLFDELNISTDGVKKILFATESITTNENSVFVFFCDDSKSAKELKKGIENALDKHKAKDFLSAYNLKTDTKIKRSGTVVAFGNKDAMKIIT